MDIKLVIFDLDGTLLYTIKDINIALNYALKGNNLEEVSVEECLYMVGSGVDHLIKKAIKDNSSFFDKVKADYINYYKEHNMIHTNPYQGIMHLLKTLKQAGIKLAVLSNKPQADSEAVINHYFNGLFDYVAGSKDGVKLKPDKEATNQVLDYFKIDKDNVLYLGDSDIDLLTAKNASLLMGACLWGYRKKCELNGADLFFNSAKEVENYIVNNNHLLVNGAIIYNKPKGITSQDALIDIKHELTRNGLVIEKIGHAGTLDPLATGVLIVLLNEATKLSNYILAEDKEYITTCKLGIKTDTYDIDGKVVDKKAVNVTNKLLDETLESFLGEQLQVPPMYSAIKVDGKKSYDLARNNKEIEIDARKINILSIERLSDINEEFEFKFKTKVSKGTYIRSLCNDLGIRLNSYGIVKELFRTKSGKFSVEEAFSIDDIKNNNYKIIEMIDLIDLEKIEVDNYIYNKVIDGKMLKKDELNYPNDNEVALIHNNKLLAIYYYDENMDRYKARRVWN